MENVETIQHSYEMYVDSSDMTNDSDDIADNGVKRGNSNHWI